MREILFKAKVIDTGEWIEGIPIKTHIGLFMCFDENPHYCNQYGYMEIDKIIKVDENTLCQFTGLTDKNGNKIWENDIVERVDRRNGLYVFREQPKMNCKVVWTDRHGYDTEPSCGYFDKKNALECSVIGNIFDNACIDESLKGEEGTISTRLCKMGYHQYMNRGVEESREEYELSKLQYAEPRKSNTYKITICGQAYLDVTEVMFPM